MVAFNIVHMRVKPGREEEFLSTQKASARAGFPGMREAYLVRTGDRDFHFVAKWDDMDALAAARPAMIGALDEVRALLETLGESGVTEPVSGDAVALRN